MKLTHAFSYDKFIYDDEVDFHRLSHNVKIVTNKWLYFCAIDSIFLCIVYPQESIIMFISFTLKFCYQKKNYTFPNNVFVHDYNVLAKIFQSMDIISCTSY
jgi:hypothetical protein